MVESAAKEVIPGGEDLTPAEAAAINADAPQAAVITSESEWPGWAPKPANLKIPPGGEICIMLFRSKWTARRDKGDRTCVLWFLSDADEKNALKRTRGEPLRSMSEMSKQMVRAVDGQLVQWGTGSTFDIEVFWNDIGPKCRQLIKNYYGKTHVLDDEEMQDFFSNCIAVREAAGG